MQIFDRAVMEEKDVLQLPSLALAHVGDAVYELLVRSYLIAQGKTKAGRMHGAAVKFVSAPAQARASQILQEHLTENENSVLHRGRNAKVNSVPRGASDAEYHAATALEALFGYLFLSGQQERVEELFDIIVKECGNSAA